jgi:hypothetical protein
MRNHDGRQASVKTIAAAPTLIEVAHSTEPKLAPSCMTAMTSPTKREPIPPTRKQCARWSERGRSEMVRRQCFSWLSASIANPKQMTTQNAIRNDTSRILHLTSKWCCGAIIHARACNPARCKDRNRSPQEQQKIHASDGVKVRVPQSASQVISGGDGIE